MPEAPYYRFLCWRCKQMSVPGETIRDQPATEPLVCPACRALDREPQGETVRLFEPAPAQMPGQTSMGARRPGVFYLSGDGWDSSGISD